MKKFLIFFMVMFGMACSAMAGSYLVSGSSTCGMVPESGASGDIAYAVYFDTGEDVPSEGCKQYFDQIRQELAALNSEDIAQFVLVASADQQGDPNYDNVALSGRRYDYVIQNILPSDVEVVKEGWIAGSASNKKFDPKYTDNWTYRSVYIYPVWRLQECTANLVAEIKKNTKVLSDASAKYPDSKDLKELLDNYTAASKICDVAGKKLTATESEELNMLLVRVGVMIETVNAQYNLGITSYTSDIDVAYSRLSEIRDSLKLNVWRDAEGKFNTARLVSDSVAGVVLGTAGGLITSHLVKKNQLKKGFEDLNCSVGGQKVAGYGDDFRIGLQ